VWDVAAPFDVDCLVDIFLGRDWRFRLFCVAFADVVVFAIDVRFWGTCRREFRDVRGAARVVVQRRKELMRARASFIIRCIGLNDKIED
jgi:hypothetical protein